MTSDSERSVFAKKVGVFQNMASENKAKKRKSTKSGKRCVVMNCQKTNLDGVSLHQFPKDEKICAKWDKFVNIKRSNGTSGSGHICSDHFKPEDYHGFMRRMEGFSSKLLLKDYAVPTIYQPAINLDHQGDENGVLAKRRKTTLDKLNAHRVSKTNPLLFSEKQVDCSDIVQNYVLLECRFFDNSR